MITRTTTFRILLTWTVLVAATILSIDMGSRHGIPGSDPRLGIVAALGIAFAKAHLIGYEFMELRRAPRTLQAVFTIWIMVVGTTLIALYLAGA
ncbi:cytochrome C oxidase subunit IV family protein [Nocardia sp. CA-119907]|uniref:cytochrome C oxidase subunit IV family protein n=1 Tax=Nocardia sp. CA-119907 TaxID=3239973 RepID=UPI003D98C1A7